jgi:hypothetical protein
MISAVSGILDVSERRKRMNQVRAQLRILREVEREGMNAVASDSDQGVERTSLGYAHIRRT